MPDRSRPTAACSRPFSASSWKRPNNAIADRHQLVYLTEITLLPDALVKNLCIVDLPFQSREAVCLIAVRRGSRIDRNPPADLTLQAADQLVVSATADELDDLARSESYMVGLQNVGRSIRLSNAARVDDVRLIGLTIGPTHRVDSKHEAACTAGVLSGDLARLR